MEKVDFTDQFYLKLQLKAPDFTRSYNVLYTYTKGEQEDTVKFNLDVTFLKTVVGYARIFEVNRTSVVYVNDLEPELIADQLADACGKVFYPLQVAVDFNGKYIGVHNHAAIVGRWKTLREEVSTYFKGEETEKYLELMEAAIATPEQLNEIFQQELFIATYFNSIYQSYTADFRITGDHYYPIAGKTTPVKFEVVQEVMPALNEARKIDLRHHGKMTDKRSFRDLADGQHFPVSHFLYPDEPSATGTYEAIYRLDAETRSIFALVAEWQLDTEPVQKTQLKVFELLNESTEEAPEAYHENEPGQFFIDGHTEKREKKITNVFSFLLGK